MLEYRIHIFLKIIIIPALILVLFGIYILTIHKEYYFMILNILLTLVLVYFEINTLVLKLVLEENKGITISGFFYFLRKHIEFKDIRKIESTDLSIIPIYILIPKEGRFMYLLGFKDISQLIFNIYKYSSTDIISSKVKRIVEKKERCK